MFYFWLGRESEDLPYSALLPKGEQSFMIEADGFITVHPILPNCTHDWLTEEDDDCVERECRKCGTSVMFSKRAVEVLGYERRA